MFLIHRNFTCRFSQCRSPSFSSLVHIVALVAISYPPEQRKQAVIVCSDGGHHLKADAWDFSKCTRTAYCRVGSFRVAPFAMQCGVSSCTCTIFLSAQRKKKGETGKVPRTLNKHSRRTAQLIKVQSLSPKYAPIPLLDEFSLCEDRDRNFMF